MSLKGFLTHLRTAEDGQTLVEFALVIPLLALLVLAIFDFGKAFNYKNDLTSLVNQAARYAEANSCLPCSGQSINNYVQSTSDSGTLRSYPALIQMCFPSGSTGQQGQELKVTASYPYSWLPLLSSKAGLGASTTLKASVIVEVQSSYNSTTPAANAYTVVPVCPT